MKIVNLEEFRLMPNGTVFSEYDPHVILGLRIKVETWELDFLYQDLIGNILAESSDDRADKLDIAEGGGSIDLDFDCGERDGLFDPRQLFAVYEETDVVSLISRLESARGLSCCGDAGP